MKHYMINASKSADGKPLVLCCFSMDPPEEWPPGQTWTENWNQVTCRDCVAKQTPQERKDYPMSQESYPPILCEEPGKTSRGHDRPRLLAWIQHHDAHGLSYDSIVWMPEGDKPEMGEWIRAFWMDEPTAWHRTGAKAGV